MPLSTAILNSYVRPGEVVAVVSGTYELRRQFVLTIALQLAVEGLPILAATTSWDSAGEQVSELVALGTSPYWHRAWGCKQLSRRELGLRLKDAPLVKVDAECQPVSRLWRCCVERMMAGRSTKSPFSLVIVAVPDLAALAMDDKGGLRSLAQVLRIPVLVVSRRELRMSELSSAVDVVIKVPDYRVGNTEPLAWVGCAGAQLDSSRLTPLLAVQSPAMVVQRTVAQLGIRFDPMRADQQRDYDGAVLGWRMLCVKEESGESGNTSAYLVSPIKETVWRHPVQVASCNAAVASQSHQAPQPDCKCGVYAHYFISDAWAGFESHREGFAALALVRAWGRVGFHASGFRAEYVQPAVLFGDLPCTLEAALRFRYDCDVERVTRERTRPG
jgi:hypothetical protein